MPAAGGAGAPSLSQILDWDTNHLYQAVTDWAVGRTANARYVALRLNGDPPVVLRIRDAREIAAALTNEAETLKELAAREDK